MVGDEFFLVENINSINKFFKDEIMMGISYRNRIPVPLKINIAKGVCLYRMIGAARKRSFR